MAEINPYEAPRANIVEAAVESSRLAPDPKSVDVGRGIAWLAEGWAMFRQAAGIWIGITLVAGAIFIALSFIPILGQLASPLLSMLMGGGIMLGCRALERGEPLTIGHLFAAFQSHLNPLLVAGALYLAGIFAIILVASVITGGAAFALWRGGPEVAAATTGMMLLVLVVLALMLPLIMAIWFAPALIALHDVAPLEAMKLSFRGCLRNLLPYIVYGVIAFMLGVFATIPFGLGWLVLLPVLAASAYAAYRDIFLA